MKPLNIIFAGTPDFAAQHLQALIDSDHRVVAVYTQPDRPAGRGEKLTSSPVKTLASTYNIPVFQPHTFKNDAAQQQFHQLNVDANIDIMVVVAYGLLLPEAVLSKPRLGCINVHGSLLPRWRGAAPIQRALWAGDVETGITIMQMDVGLDTGDILLKKTIPILAIDTSASLYEKLANVGQTALLEALAGLSVEQLIPQKQNDVLATHAKKLSKTEAHIDWNKSATALWCEVRAFNPWPVSYFEINDHVVKVWQVSIGETKSVEFAAGTIINVSKQGIEVATQEGSLILQTLQLAGKKAMPVADILNSKADWFTKGQILS